MAEKKASDSDLDILPLGVPIRAEKGTSAPSYDRTGWIKPGGKKREKREMVYETTSPRMVVIFLFLVGVYVLAWVFWERIPELARGLPHYEKTSVFVGEGLQKVESVRDYVLNSKLSEYVWQNRATFAGGYALLGLLMLVNPIYRNDPERFTIFCRTGCMVLGGILVLIIIAWLGATLDEILKPRTNYSHPTPEFGNMFLKLVHALLMIAFMIVMFAGFYGGIYIGLPIALLFLLFLLPGTVWDILCFAVRAPFLLWRYLHYLTVPHPMEEVIFKREKVKMKRGVEVDHAAFVEEMSRAKYDPKRDGIPPWWKSDNWTRRLKNAAALKSRLKTEKQVANEYTEERIERNKQQQ